MDSVQEYINEHKISYAVPIDNDFEAWKKYENRFWPTLYLIDKQGIVQPKTGSWARKRTDHTSHGTPFRAC